RRSRARRAPDRCWIGNSARLGHIPEPSPESGTNHFPILSNCSPISVSVLVRRAAIAADKGRMMLMAGLNALALARFGGIRVIHGARDGFGLLLIGLVAI